MDRVGVDGAIFISAFSMYRYDASYAVEVQRASSRPIRLVKPVDPDDPAVADVIATGRDAGHSRHPDHDDERGGARSERPGPRPDPARSRSLRLSGQHALLGNVTRARRSLTATPTRDSSSTIWPSCSPERRPPAAALGRSAEGAGARQTPERGDQGQRCLHAVQRTVSLPDIWDPLARVFDAWGFERCLWGTDWTRAFAVVNYEQAVEPFRQTDRLNDSERAMLMGGACAKAYGWSPKKR